MDNILEELQGEEVCDDELHHDVDDVHELNEYNGEAILGKEFTDIDSAYRFYIGYGGKLGFNVRIRNNRKNSVGFVTWVRYCCSREGTRKLDKRRTNVSYSQPITRCGCQAHMSIKLGKNGHFKVTSFKGAHNHDLVNTPIKHMLKINRSMSTPQKAHADDGELSGLSGKGIVEFMSREVGGRENLGFSHKDYLNYIHSKRKLKMERGDAGAILHYFQKKQAENSSYFYSIQLDEDDMITNIFWADARSVSDYSLFGDVICFDTTYRTNECGRPFAPIVGMNHHKQTILLGAALLYDETTESFQWLFETFLSAMSGKHLMTILTDQSAAMARAIKCVFPHTIHRLCVWHLYQNAAKHLSHVFHGSSTFADNFSRCMYDYEFEDEWLLAWNGMLVQYGLKENKWLNALFEFREKWALVYVRDSFTVDMKSTQRSECINNVLKKYLKPEHSLLRFLEHYERVLADRRYEELIAEYKMIQSTPPLAVSAHMLQHGADIYTPKVFLIFQGEFVRIHNYSAYKVAKFGMITKYKVSYSSEHQEHLVKYEGSTQAVECSCKKFTFVGVLCAHALKVLDKKNVKKIHAQYILNRWTRATKTMTISSYHENEVPSNPQESMGKRYSYLRRTFRDVAIVAAYDEELTKHAHHCLVEMLRSLEEIKKNRREKEETRCSHGSEEINACQGEEVEGIVQSTDAEAKVVRGVKNKATVGRPQTRFKDPIEKKRSQVTRKSTKPATRRNFFKERINNLGYDRIDFDEESRPLLLNMTSILMDQEPSTTDLYNEIQSYVPDMSNIVNPEDVFRSESSAIQANSGTCSY